MEIYDTLQGKVVQSTINLFNAVKIKSLEFFSLCAKRAIDHLTVLE